jgi:hypothetical protein
MPAPGDDKPKLEKAIDTIKSIVNSDTGHLCFLGLMLAAIVALLVSTVLLLLGLVAPTFDAKAWAPLALVWAISFAWLWKHR